MDNKTYSLAIKQGISKAGKDYNYLEVKIGEYSARLFPTPIEQKYIANILEKNA